MLEALGDATILSMLLSVALSILGAKMGSLPVMVVSSLGWIYVGLGLYSDVGAPLPMALSFMIAFAQVFLVAKK